VPAHQRLERADVAGDRAIQQHSIVRLHHGPESSTSPIDAWTHPPWQSVRFAPLGSLGVSDKP
jgi:hypothetical protein